MAYATLAGLFNSKASPFLLNKHFKVNNNNNNNNNEEDDVQWHINNRMQRKENNFREKYGNGEIITEKLN